MFPLLALAKLTFQLARYPARQHAPDSIFTKDLVRGNCTYILILVTATFPKNALHFVSNSDCDEDDYDDDDGDAYVYYDDEYHNDDDDRDEDDDNSNL